MHTGRPQVPARALRFRLGLKSLLPLIKGPHDSAVRRFLLANRIDINATNVGAHDFFELVVRQTTPLEAIPDRLHPARTVERRHEPRQVRFIEVGALLRLQLCYVLGRQVDKSVISVAAYSDMVDTAHVNCVLNVIVIVLNGTVP